VIGSDEQKYVCPSKADMGADTDDGQKFKTSQKRWVVVLSIMALRKLKEEKSLIPQNSRKTDCGRHPSDPQQQDRYRGSTHSLQSF